MGFGAVPGETGSFLRPSGFWPGGKSRPVVLRFHPCRKNLRQGCFPFPVACVSGVFRSRRFPFPAACIPGGLHSRRLAFPAACIPGSLHSRQLAFPAACVPGVFVRGVSAQDVLFPAGLPDCPFCTLAGSGHEKAAGEPAAFVILEQGRFSTRKSPPVSRSGSGRGS